MSNRVFTDDSTGEKFEAQTSATTDGWVFIKPIEAEEKKPYCLDFFDGHYSRMTKHYLLNEGLDLTEHQATAIAEAIKSLMEYITYPKQPNVEEYNLRKAVEEARKALGYGV